MTVLEELYTERLVVAIVLLSAFVFAAIVFLLYLNKRLNSDVPQNIRNIEVECECVNPCNAYCHEKRESSRASSGEVYNNQKRKLG